MREIILDFKDKSIERVKVTFVENDKVSIVYVKSTGDTVTKESTGGDSSKACGKDYGTERNTGDSNNGKESNENFKTADRGRVATERKKYNIRWTPERIEEFCKDYATMSLSDVSKKWGLKKSSCVTRKCMYADIYDKIRSVKEDEGEQG